MAPIRVTIAADGSCTVGADDAATPTGARTSWFGHPAPGMPLIPVRSPAVPVAVVAVVPDALEHARVSAAAGAAADTLDTLCARLGVRDIPAVARDYEELAVGLLLAIERAVAAAGPRARLDDSGVWDALNDFDDTVEYIAPDGVTLDPDAAAEFADNFLLWQEQ